MKSPGEAGLFMRARRQPCFRSAPIVRAIASAAASSAAALAWVSFIR